jgi:acyl-CoA reductase-like NAD-dependent aldehyde dehydrogenase
MNKKVVRRQNMDKSIKEQVEGVIQRARMAAAVFSQFNQKKTDHIVKKVYEAGFRNRVKLAKMAHEETGLGVWQHKVMKNTIATQIVYEDIKNQFKELKKLDSK